jgi:hypothetical protein
MLTEYFCHVSQNGERMFIEILYIEWYLSPIINKNGSIGSGGYHAFWNNVAMGNVDQSYIVHTVYFYSNKLLITQNPSSYSYTSMYLICSYI